MSDIPVSFPRYSFPEEVDETLSIAQGGPITQKFLEGLEKNSDVSKNIAIDPLLKNVRGRPNQAGKNPFRKVDHKRVLSRNIVVWADVYKINFGGATTVGTTDGQPSWKGFRYDFPTNDDGDYFHDDYLPAVVAQIITTPGVDFPRLSLVMTRISTNWFKFDVYQIEAGTYIQNSDDLYVSILAMGKQGDYHAPLEEVLITPNTYTTIP